MNTVTNVLNGVGVRARVWGGGCHIDLKVIISSILFSSPAPSEARRPTLRFNLIPVTSHQHNDIEFTIDGNL